MALLVMIYHGIKKEDLLNFSRSDLLKLPSIGKSICDEIERAIAKDLLDQNK